MKYGETAAYLAARLKKDRPDIAEAMLAKTFKTAGLDSRSGGYGIF